MPDVKTEATASTYQQCDGTNFSTAGLEATMKVGQGNVSFYGGVGTSFTNGSTGFIADIKGSVPYGDSIFSGGFRVRNNLNGNSQTIQFRVQPATVTIPFNNNVSGYVTPYLATKLDYNNGKPDTKIGCYGGLSIKTGNVKWFVEGQIYDVTKFNASATSINAGVKIPL